MNVPFPAASESRNLAWKLNWYRQSELEGALLLGRMIRLASHPQLIERLTRHCADEARHSQLWADCVVELGLPFIRIHRSYQSLYLDHGGAPASLLEVLAFTQVFERRVHKRFNAELAASTLPEPARRTFAVMIDDEKDHLEWVHDWLQSQPGAETLLQKFQAIDLTVYDQILPYEDRLWDVPGLGEELRPT